MPRQGLPKPPPLPKLLQRKLYKTGQTRGADDDVIYQNRVSRNSTVLIPYKMWPDCAVASDGEPYENGYIVLLSPEAYFDLPSERRLTDDGLALGENALVHYETRDQWDRHNPAEFGWTPATSRTAPLGGQYVARIPGTTAAGGDRISFGFNTRQAKGAGIRVYEYASSATTKDCRIQLEALFWRCRGAPTAVATLGMSRRDSNRRKMHISRLGAERGLLDEDHLVSARAIDSAGNTVCPLCLGRLAAKSFFKRVAQAAGREVNDITVTDINLFHISELRPGETNHVPYNLAWGHHHCNTVVRDTGIDATLAWMRHVLRKNHAAGRPRK